MELVTMEYQDMTVAFTEAAWFNATEVANRYGKRPVDWLRLPETRRYIKALCQKYEVKESHFVKTKRGGDLKTEVRKSHFDQGTWMHPKLAVRFAQWLDIDFAIWCDEQIDSLLRGSHPHYDWKRLRHEATASYKVLGHILQMTRERLGKTTAPHHFSNEARLINYALTGVFGKVDRDGLSQGDLDLLAKLENLDTVMIGCGMDYDYRKKELERFAEEQRAMHTPALASA